MNVTRKIAQNAPTRLGSPINTLKKAGTPLVEESFVHHYLPKIRSGVRSLRIVIGKRVLPFAVLLTLACVEVPKNDKAMSKVNPSTSDAPHVNFVAEKRLASTDLGVISAMRAETPLENRLPEVGQLNGPWSLSNSNSEGLEEAVALFFRVRKEDLRLPSRVDYLDHKLYVGISSGELYLLTSESGGNP